MHIQVNSDRNIEGGQEMTRQIVSELETALDRFSERITRVEVHLNDVNGPRSVGPDKRCLREARLSGIQPIVVSHQAATLADAIDGATDKLVKSLDRTLGKQHDPKGRSSYGGDQTL